MMFGVLCALDVIRKSSSLENKALNFPRFNVIQNLQQFVTIGSKLIQNLNKELFAGGDHLLLICLECVGCLYSASHSILISLREDAGSIL